MMDMFIAGLVKTVFAKKEELCFLQSVSEIMNVECLKIIFYQSTSTSLLRNVLLLTAAHFPLTEDGIGH